jgi:hypothetical protein
MNSLVLLNNINNSKNLLIIDEFTKLINETKYVIEYYSSYKKTKSTEGNYVDNLIFKLAAFEISLAGIKNYNYVINNGNQLKKIKGIGKGTIERINYILKSGKLESEYTMLPEIYKIQKQEENVENVQQETEKDIQTELGGEKEIQQDIQQEKVELETEKEIQQDIQQEKVELETEKNIQTDIQQVIQQEKVELETEKNIQTDIQVDIQPEKVELETEKNILVGCLGSTFSALNNLKSVFCSFYNEMYVNFNDELNLI